MTLTEKNAALAANGLNPNRSGRIVITDANFEGLRGALAAGVALYYVRDDAGGSTYTTFADDAGLNVYGQSNS